MIKRRLCNPPHKYHDETLAGGECPDIFELENGNIGVIGIKKTEVLKKYLPSDASCGYDEEIVEIPKYLLIEAYEGLNK